MNVNEIRIGNWLNDVDSQTFQVDAADIVGLSQYEKAGKINPHYNPIPLSKKVLIACGFNFSGSLWDIETEDNGLFFIEFAGNCVTITAKGKEWGHCTSLHELQNLFYCLTKTELNYQP